jgi:hypothetical protein
MWQPYLDLIRQKCSQALHILEKRCFWPLLLFTFFCRWNLPLFAQKPNRLMGLSMSVYDIAATVLHVYGLPVSDQMRGRALTEIFESSSPRRELSANH